MDDLKCGFTGCVNKQICDTRNACQINNVSVPPDTNVPACRSKNHNEKEKSYLDPKSWPPTVNCCQKRDTVAIAISNKADCTRKSSDRQTQPLLKISPDVYEVHRVSHSMLSNTDSQKYHIPGYSGHVPCMSDKLKTFGISTHLGLNQFSSDIKRHHQPHLGQNRSANCGGLRKLT